MFESSHQSIQRLKIIANVILVVLLTFNLCKRAFLSIPNDWFFFLTSGAIENFLCMVIAYYFVLKFTAHRWKIPVTLLSISALLGLSLLKDCRIHGDFSFGQTFEYFSSFLGLSLLFYLMVFIINKFDFFRRYIYLEKELRNSREQLLRNQLNPHFLFNAFNSLYSLALKKHPDTPTYILKLSDMMRYLTDDMHADEIPLTKELNFIEKYIAIERMRFGEDARIQFNVDRHNQDALVAPFLLTTLVENAFKHGFYTNIKSAFVAINVKFDGKELICNVENSLSERQHFQGDYRHGKGLINLNKRLELIYSKRSTLIITETQHSYNTLLKIILTK